MRQHLSSALGTALAIALVIGWGTAPASAAQASVSPQKSDAKALEARACGTSDNEVNYDVKTDKDHHPTPDPEPGKALVYIYRSGLLAGAVQAKAAIDGKWIGANLGNNYFFVQLASGEHHICSKAENNSILTIDVEAGKTYYVRQEISIGTTKARNFAVLMDDEKGKKEMDKCHPSISTEKKK
jgi:hypothetical protein